MPNCKKLYSGLLSLFITFEKSDLGHNLVRGPPNLCVAFNRKVSRMSAYFYVSVKMPKIFFKHFLTQGVVTILLDVYYLMTWWLKSGYLDTKVSQSNIDGS